jgi:hypothetical protein
MAVSLFSSAELLVEFLDDAKLLESDKHEAQIAQLYLLADALDEHPDNAALHREFRAVEEGLRGLAGVGLDELAVLMAAFGSGDGGG